MTKAVEYRLLLVQPSTIFTALVNETTFTSTDQRVDYDGASGLYTDIEQEMMLLLGTSAGDDDLGRVRVRLPATDTRLYFGWSSRAKGEGEAYLVNDAHITITDLFKPWTRNPRIADTGVTYTDYGRDFATYGALPPAILLGCGPATQQPLDPVTEKATFSFDASGSYVTHNAATAISIYAWTLPGSAVVTGGAVDQAAVTFTLPVGAHWVKLVVTDDFGTSATRRVLCVAGEPSGTISKFDSLSLVRRPEGQTLNVRVSENIPESTYPNGCMAVLWKRQTVDGVEVTPGGLSGHEHICFVGWHYMDDLQGRATEVGFIDDTKLEFRDVGGWLQVLPGYPIVIERDNTPGRWEEMAAADIDRYFMRLLAEYTNVLVLTDFSWSGLGSTYYPFSTLASEGETLYQQVDGRAQAIAHKLTCDQWGRLAIKPDPQLLDDATGSYTPIKRTTTVQKALTEAEWSTVVLSTMPFPRVNWNWASAIVAAAYDVDAVSRIGTVFCVAPGKAPSQGSAQQNSGEQLVTGQNELNAREGHRYATRMNNPLPSIEIELADIDDFAIQPAYMTWVTFTNSASTAGVRQRVYTAQKCLPIEVEITHDSASGTQRVTVRAEKEVVGSPAQTYVPPETDYGDYGTGYDWPTEYTFDWEYDLGRGLNKFFFVDKDGILYLTSDFTTKSVVGGPTYTPVDLALDGTVLDGVTDPYSPLYLGTGTTVNAWVLTSTSIYRITDVGNVVSRAVTLQHTFAVASMYRTIQTERATQNWLVVASYYPGAGVKACYTTDGTNWTEVTVSTDAWGDDNPTILGGSGATTVFIEPASWWQQQRFTAPKSDFYKHGFAWEARSYKVIGAWFTVSDHTSSGFVKQMSRDQSMYPIDYSYTGLWNDTSQKDHEGDFVTVRDYAAPGWTAEAIKNLINPAYTSRGGTYLKPVDAGNKIWTGWQHGWAAGSWTLTVRLIGYGTPPEGGSFSGDPTPAVHVSGKTPGLCYVGAVNGAAGDLYVSTNYGATWSLATGPGHDFQESLGMGFHFPWADNPSDSLYFWGNYDLETQKNAFKRSDGATITTLTPTGDYAPAGPRSIATSAVDRNELALMGRNVGNQHAGFRSRDGGGTWMTILPDASRAASYVRCHIADDPDVMYFWGPAGVAYSSDGGEVIDNRNGDASPGEVILIGGW